MDIVPGMKVREAIRSEGVLVSIEPEIYEVQSDYDGLGKYDWYIIDSKGKRKAVIEEDLEPLIQWGFVPGAKVNILIPLDGSYYYQKDPVEVWEESFITRKDNLEGWWAVRNPHYPERELFFPENHLELLELPTSSKKSPVEETKEEKEPEPAQLSSKKTMEQLSLFEGVR